MHNQVFYRLFQLSFSDDRPLYPQVNKSWVTIFFPLVLLANFANLTFVPHSQNRGAAHEFMVLWSINRHCTVSAQLNHHSLLHCNAFLVLRLLLKKKVKTVGRNL